jgi:glycine C-acetyltransferase
MAQSGRLKGDESPIRGVIPARDGHGPRYLIEGEGDTPFLRMNSNSYLGMALRAEIVAAEEKTAAACGTGPGAVRFISGTWSAHTALGGGSPPSTAGPAAMLFLGLRDMMGSLPLAHPRQDAVIARAQPQPHHQRDRAGAAGRNTSTASRHERAERALTAAASAAPSW